MRSYDEYKTKPSAGPNLFEMAKSGNIEMLIAEKALNPALDLNTRDPKGYSPLMYAAYYNQYETAQWLIAQGGDMNSPDRGGNTILMGVAFKGHTRIARLLIEAGADVEAVNQLGMNALKFAEMFGRTEVVSLISGTHKGFFQRKVEQISTWYFYMSQKLHKKENYL